MLTSKEVREFLEIAAEVFPIPSDAPFKHALVVDQKMLRLHLWFPKDEKFVNFPVYLDDNESLTKETLLQIKQIKEMQETSLAQEQS